MKTLTKIRLINWHYFENETIDIKNNTLLTGQNASGKSTILDAVSFVLTAGDQNFNLAANEKGKRDLRGYVKCKLGSLDQEYLRDYDLSGHICLEFYSEKQERYFCLGTIIDVVGEIQPPKVVFYIIDGPMKDEYFISSDYEVKSIADFKKSKITPYIFTTRKEAKAAFRQKMGGISEKYFTLIPKALAFKPITDVKDYIYQHLLEEKAIDVENIKDSIRSYKEFEQILKIAKQKIQDLTQMTDTYSHLKEIKENQDFFNYLLMILRNKDNLALIDNKEKQIHNFELERDNVAKDIRDTDEEIAQEDDKSKQMYASLNQNQDFKASEIYDRDIKKAENDLSYANEKKREYDRKVVAFKDGVQALKSNEPKLASALQKINLGASNLDEVQEELLAFDNAKEMIEAKKTELTQNETTLLQKKQQAVDSITLIYKSLNTLSSNNIPYSPELTALRTEMEQHLKELYQEDISVHVLAEIIEVKDPSWQDTVENLLAAQRFTLIVEPKYYDDCLEVYDERKSKNIYGINLLNTKKIQNFTSYQPNSLASIIETENRDARLYINYIIGNLIMVNDVKELDHYQQSITKSGMLYRGFVTRYLNPNIEKPFIGKLAAQKQREKYNLMGENAKIEFQNITDSLNKIKETRDVINSLDIVLMKELVSNVGDVIKLSQAIQNLKEKKEHLSLTSVSELRHEYEVMLEGIRVLEQKKGTYQMKLGANKQAIDNLNSQILDVMNANKALEVEIAQVEVNHLDYRSRAEALYQENAQAGKSTKEIQADFEKEINEEIQSIKSLESGLTLAQVNYITKYNRPFGTGYDAMEQYLDEMDKLVKSELVKYEAKVRDSREEAEKLFKEDFLSKLRSYILEAQDEIEKINETLGRISFGSDTYQFVFPKSREFGAIYDMITDQTSDTLGYSIFNVDFEEKYQKELDELFNNLSSDEDNSQGALNKYTDYRTYMDYDIKINSGDDVFYFSNISKEKSGGETQIPFYVAILASFVRLFSKAEKNGLDDSIGLILFDEVFDKMDTSRTDAMMEFISHLPVQIILACPPQKMEGLQNHTDTTVAVFRENKKAGCVIIRGKNSVDKEEIPENS